MPVQATGKKKTNTVPSCISQFCQHVASSVNHDISMHGVLLQKLEAAMVRTMVVKGFRIHERQRQMKEEAAQLTEMNAIFACQPGWPQEV
ncbi:hypothetical protein [Citrobacter sp. C411]